MPITMRKAWTHPIQWVFGLVQHRLRAKPSLKKKIRWNSTIATSTIVFWPAFRGHSTRIPARWPHLWQYSTTSLQSNSASNLAPRWPPARGSSLRGNSLTDPQRNYVEVVLRSLRLQLAERIVEKRRTSWHGRSESQGGNNKLEFLYFRREAMK